jgi:tyrosyl-tRNA synthetase
LYYDDSLAIAAEKDFDTKFVQKEIPDDIPEARFPSGETLIAKLLNETGLTASAGEGKRMVKQGAVKIDGKKVSDPMAPIFVNKEMVIQVGKRKFLKIIPE